MQQFGINPGDRVGIALPNGPELGILLLSVCARACACPVNPQSTAGEIVQDLGEVRTKCLIVLAGGSNDHLVEAASTMGVPLLTVIPSDTECGIFSLVSATGGKIAGGSRATVPGSVMTINPGISTDRFNASAWTAPDQHALVLHTSGTSGKKKIVPYSLRTMVVGSACIVKSWMLTQNRHEPGAAVAAPDAAVDACSNPSPRLDTLSASTTASGGNGTAGSHSNESKVAQISTKQTQTATRLPGAHNNAGSS